MKEITMLGTGHAAVQMCYNTCFAIREGSEFFLVDAGGGNGILRQLKAVGLPWNGLRGMFITHAHTDHITGAIWVVRMMQGVVRRPDYPGDFCIWCHDEVAETLRFMCDNMLANGAFDYAGGKIKIIEVKDGESFDCFGVHFTAFDIFSTKKKQFGFRAEVDGKTLVCLGDEPYNPLCEKYALGADLLMCEAFCMERDSERIRPHEKHHGTAREAAALAKTLGAGSLLLYHTEESDLAHRKENYTAEAAEVFDGTIYVPDDLETIRF